ncbi:uncharacterized protein LOC127123512 [Lathyrus oleraceus]|uniref:uncharacterized protein LOC127123512 n=1 Tax=Pisum sativum TaxID=3888 RepID=UPI0021D04625|nr:uncharacterized protein LOC127123512 [Pisum sativum]
MSDSSSSESCNPNREYPVSDSANTSHARRPKETVSGFSSALALDEQTREDSRYVHNSIATLVTGILSGNHKVLGVSVPLNTIVPENDACQENTVSLAKNVSDEAEQIDAHEGSNIEKPLENVGNEVVRVTHDVSDNPKADTVDLEELSDNELWKYMYHKRLALERELAQNVLECKEIVDPIQEAGLMKTVTQLSKFYETLVKEFIVNVSEEYADSKSREFRKVYVRGKCVNFSPSVINMYLGRPDVAQPELEVTDNKICQVITANQVRKWPLKGKLVASKLSVKYAMLHKIGASNWVPTNHKSIVVVMLGKFIYAVGTKAKFDYGTYIFYQTMKHAGSFSVKGPIAFPSLICGIVLNQFPNILTENEFVKRRESPLAFNYKLFLGKHVPDIAMTTGETSSVCNQPGKVAVIAILRETCKELEARKLTLENLIIKLEMSEAAEATEGVARQSAEGGEDASPDDGTDDEADSESDD